MTTFAAPGEPDASVAPVGGRDHTSGAASEERLASLSRDLELAHRELARSNADLAQFVAMVAHDLKSPVQVILGFSQLLAKLHGDHLGEEGRKLLGSIANGATEVTGLIDDLVLYGRVGSSIPMKIDVDLEEVLAGVRDILGPEIHASRAVISSRALPTVVGDPVQLQQVFQCLVSNAIKFTADGLVPEVQVSAQRAGDGWCLAVADNGIGVEAAERDQIFGMLARRPGRNTNRGTGMGLAVCKRIVERMGGDLWVEDNPGGGSRFCFNVPDPPARLGRDSELPATADTASPGPKPLQILLVEDSTEHAKLIAAQLAQAHTPGYRLHPVDSVRAALAALVQIQVDCVLLDLSLPDASDLEALAQIRGAAPMLPVVVITALSDEALAFAAVREGAQDFLVKGQIDSERLSRAIRWAVQRKALETDLARDALHDPLTHLPNRTLLLDRLRLALARARRSGGTVAVLYLDLDKFKQVNDLLGHHAGDQALIVTAERLERVVRPQDTVARIGGDEFVVVCEGFDDLEQEVDSLRLRLRNAVADPIAIGDERVLFTASIGASLSGPCADAGADALAEEMLRAADLAMFQAKRAGCVDSR